MHNCDACDEQACGVVGVSDASSRVWSRLWS